MLTRAECDDVIVTVAHPYADTEITLRRWIESGPGLHPVVTITAACRRNGDPLPLEAISRQCHNGLKVDGFSDWAPRCAFGPFAG